MRENKYDDGKFFEQYSKMERSVHGLAGAGEWHELKKMLPEFEGKRVLDLGCGFGWHCKYAVEQGAEAVMGIDISEKMLEQAKKINKHDNITYMKSAIEEYLYPENFFDIVISSLALHYVVSFEEVAKKVYRCLRKHGSFVFSVEHPIFTAYGTQDWHYDEQGQIKHWPVDSYFEEGLRHAHFLGEEVIKYHKTLTTYINELLRAGFIIDTLVEPKPDSSMLEAYPQMKQELRRPMMLLIAVHKEK